MILTTLDKFIWTILSSQVVLSRRATRSEPPCHPSSAAVPPEDKRKNIELKDRLPYRLSVTVCLSEHNGSSTKFEDIILQGKVLSSTIVL